MSPPSTIYASCRHRVYCSARKAQTRPIRGQLHDQIKSRFPQGEIFLCLSEDEEAKWEVWNTD